MVIHQCRQVIPKDVKILKTPWNQYAHHHSYRLVRVFGNNLVDNPGQVNPWVTSLWQSSLQMSVLVQRAVLLLAMELTQALLLQLLLQASIIKPE